MKDIFIWALNFVDFFLFENFLMLGVYASGGLWGMMVTHGREVCVRLRVRCRVTIDARPALSCSVEYHADA